MNARELAPRHAQIARHRRPAGQDDGVEVALQLLRIPVHADVAAGAERHAFLAHQRQPALQPALLELELRNPVAKQAADAIGALEHRHEVAGAVQLIGGRQPRRARADNGHPFAGARWRGLRGDPPFRERALDDRHLRRLDRDRRIVDPQHARSLARRGTQASGEFGKVVRRVEPIDGGAPPIAIDEVVPVGNQVAERATLMTERDAAVHAARRLILQRGWLVRQRDFPPVANPFGNRPRRRLLPLDFEKAGGLTHARPADPAAPALVPASTPLRALACSPAASPS